MKRKTLTQGGSGSEMCRKNVTYYLNGQLPQNEAYFIVQSSNKLF
jgi:hypothetical protein